MPKPSRIYHTWDQWECYPAGFYETGVKGRTEPEVLTEYADFLSKDEWLKGGIDRVLKTWVKSCEHYLTNERMNRLSWVCQAAACVETGSPSRYWPVFYKLPKDRQKAVYDLALAGINRWMTDHGYDALTLEDAGINTKVNLY